MKSRWHILNMHINADAQNREMIVSLARFTEFPASASRPSLQPIASMAR